MKILILGGAGFLGSNLVRWCLQKGEHKILVVDFLDSRLKSTIDNLWDVIHNIEFIEGDMRNTKLMEKLVKDKDVIINCAAQTSHPLSLNDPFFDAEINCLGNLTLLEAIRKYNKRAKIIYISSSTVIGRSRGNIVTESHRESPLDIYSANKGVAEKYYQIYNRVYDLKTLTLRFANLYGPYGKGFPEFGFVNYFIALAFLNKEITIYGDGSQNRNVMYVEDATDLIYKCIFQDNIFGDIYFAVHREHYSVLKIAQEIISVFGSGEVVKVEWPDIKKRIEISNTIISGEKLFYLLQWEPKFNLHEGLSKTKKIMEKLTLEEKRK